MVAYQELILATLSALLQQFEHVTVLGQASTGAQAQASLTLQTSTLLLVDIDQPDGPDLSAVTLLRRTYASLPIVVSTLFVDATLLHTLINYSIQAYLTKDLSPQQFLRALEIVAAGGSFVSPTLITKLYKTVGHSETGYPTENLTLREQELFNLLCQGNSLRTIANYLHLSEQTVRNYASVLYGKLGVRSKGELIAQHGPQIKR